MPTFKPDFKEGFVVKGSESAEFLRETLSQMGLTPKEYNEFIVYWAPKSSKDNPYPAAFSDLPMTTIPIRQNLK